MKTIEDRCKEYLKEHSCGYYISTPPEFLMLFEAGYELAKKELEEQLSGIRKFLLDIEEYEHEELSDRARAYLEKWK